MIYIGNMEKYLVITSDDFGVCHSVNKGILKGFTHGLLTSSNFMATTPWFPEAIRMTKDNDLPIGVHLTLTSEWSNLKHRPLTKAASLVDEDGYFFSSYEDLFKKLNAREAEEEYIAQMEMVLRTGIKPTHIETHMIPPLNHDKFPEGYYQIVDIVRDVAKQYGLIYTYETEQYKYKYFDDVFELTRRNYTTIINSLKGLRSGIYHIISHCGIDSEELRSLSTVSEPVYTWGASARQNDLDIITSNRFKAFLDNEEFKLIGIKELLELI